MLQDILSNFDFLTWPGSDSGSGWHGNITWQFWAPTSCGLYIIFSRTSAKAERDLTNLSCVFLYVDLFWSPPAENVISTRNFLISSPDLVSAPKFTLEWYSFSNRSLKVALLKIYFNITKLLRKFKKNDSFSKAMQDSMKMLPHFGEKGCSPNENAGFPVTTKLNAE